MIVWNVDDARSLLLCLICAGCATKVVVALLVSLETPNTRSLTETVNERSRQYKIIETTRLVQSLLTICALWNSIC